LAKGLYKMWLEPDNLIRLSGWARDGLTDKQIAKNIGINVATLYTWKNKYSDFDNALKKAKEVVDYEVENALLRNALGYEYEEVETWIEKVGGVSKQRIKKTKRYSKPETLAQIFWLKNRKPTVWRQNVKVEEADDFDGVEPTVIEKLNNESD